MRTLTTDAPAPTAALLLRAIELGREGMLARRGGPFGALIARAGDSSVVAEGCNRVTSTNDPTAHAEITAIRAACASLGTFILAGHVLYTSCEPCPMCLASAYWARIGRIIYGNTRDDAAAIGFDDAFIYDEMPRAPGDRAIAMEHVPSAEATAAFAAWMAKADKITY